MVDRHQARSVMWTMPGRMGWLGVALGLILMILGIAVLVRPGASLVLLAVLFGIQLLAVGVVRCVTAAANQAAPRWWRVVTGVMGLAVVAAGLFCLFRPRESLVILATLIAVGWLIDAVITLISALTVHRMGWSRVIQVIIGLVGLAAGIILLVWPEKSLVVVTQLVGVIMIVLGTVAIIGALQQMRRDEEP